MSKFTSNPVQILKNNLLVRNVTDGEINDIYDFCYKEYKKEFMHDEDFSIKSDDINNEIDEIVDDYDLKLKRRKNINSDSIYSDILDDFGKSVFYNSNIDVVQLPTRKESIDQIKKTQDKLNQIGKKYEKKFSEISLSQTKKLESFIDFEGKSNVEDLFMSSINSILNFTKTHPKKFEYLSEENELFKSRTLQEITETLMLKHSKGSEVYGSKIKFTESSNMMTVDFDLSRSISNFKQSVSGEGMSRNNSDLMISNPNIFDPDNTHNHTGLSFGSSVISKDLDTNSYNSYENMDENANKNNVNLSIDMTMLSDNKPGFHRKASNLNMVDSRLNSSPVLKNLQRPKKK